LAGAANFGAKATKTIEFYRILQKQSRLAHPSNANALELSAGKAASSGKRNL
jgi:hypothetical protein